MSGSHFPGEFFFLFHLTPHTADLDFSLYLSLHHHHTHNPARAIMHRGYTTRKFLCDTQDTTDPNLHGDENDYERTNAQHHRPCVLQGRTPKSMLWLRMIITGDWAKVQSWKDIARAHVGIVFVLRARRRLLRPCHALAAAHNRETAFLFLFNTVIDLRGRSVGLFVAWTF